MMGMPKKIPLQHSRCRYPFLSRVDARNFRSGVAMCSITLGTVHAYVQRYQRQSIILQLLVMFFDVCYSIQVALSPFK